MVVTSILCYLCVQESRMRCNWNSPRLMRCRQTCFEYESVSILLIPECFHVWQSLILYKYKLAMYVRILVYWKRSNLQKHSWSLMTPGRISNPSISVITVFPGCVFSVWYICSAHIHRKLAHSIRFFKTYHTRNHLNKCN